ncbi:hypothetical protein OEA41_003996 [Lepraria neglecta]|uniref:Heterokaryon incompatibility domain-containing protein n=1 Tax=Lepraria neglecta TaxID=209136 RepID=A0AAE0DIY4_9LECA|nr:hypothetical protein OEA41_003996 [Lepraria neglecta]
MNCPLPGTFKDAIKVTRKLRSAFGVSYIWIDALCVIQDSVEDWQQESSAMGDTYRSSFCNLAACVGPDSYSGLFQDYDPFSSHTCVVRAAMGDSAQAFYEIENHETLHTDVESSYLESRAWVVQEILLAPRILYFTPHRLIWECGSLGASEKAPNEMLLGSPRKRRWFGGPALLTRTVNEQEHPDYWLYRIWMNTVNDYTGRNLTRSEDKLVAISGLAKQVHTSFAIPDEYVVGLWKRNLLLHMQWRLRYGHQTIRPKPYRAPSWSWASVDGTIYNHRTNQEAVENCSAMVDILKMDITHLTDDIFGQVKSAELLIKGSLLEIELEFQAQSRHQLVTTAHLQWRRETFTKIGEDVIDLDFATSADSAPTSTYCMPFIREKYGESPETLVSLLLERVPGSPGMYQRFGGCDLVRGIRHVLGMARFRELSKDEYIKSHGNGMYTIVIV